MRLWHQTLIPLLPRQQLLGQHRECCALRGKGWGKKHSTVDYVFKHKYELLVAYHSLIMNEMANRGYKVDKEWLSVYYRGKELKHTAEASISFINNLWNEKVNKHKTIYSEHDESYLIECIDNLHNKGIEIKI